MNGFAVYLYLPTANEHELSDEVDRIPIWCWVKRVFCEVRAKRGGDIKHCGRDVVVFSDLLLKKRWIPTFF